MTRKPRSVEGGRSRVNAASRLAAWETLARVLEDLVVAPSPVQGLLELAQFMVDRLGADHAVILSARSGGDGYDSAGAAGLDDVQNRGGVLAYARQLARWVERTRLPVAVADPGSDQRFADPPKSIGLALAFPIGTRTRVLGALVLFDLEDSAITRGRELRDRILPFVTRVLALVSDHEHTRNRIRELSKTRDRLEGDILRLERLAAVGDLAADMARELKAPLSSLGGLAGRIMEKLSDDDPDRRLLEIMVQESGRLDRLLGDQLELARTRDPELAPDDVNRILEECLMLVADEIREKKVRITKRMGRRMPALLLEPDLMRRVFLNLMRAGLDGAAEGSRVRVESKRRGNKVEVVIAADGNRSPGQVLESLWTPFRVESRGEGNITSAGVQRIIDEHRGVLTVLSTPEWPLVFSLVLPIANNRDRRQGSPDRRRRKDRRRA